MSIFRLTGSLAGAVAITLICCLMAPLMSREADLQLQESNGSVRVCALPSPVKKQEKIKIVPKKIFPASTPRRKKKVKKAFVRPEEIRLTPLKMEAVPLMAAGLPVPLSAPLPAAPAPVKVNALKPGLGVAGVYQLASVDVQPRIKQFRHPLYPSRAKGQGVEGKVVVRCVVTEGGKVKASRILMANPAGYFERAVLKAVKTWTFVPAKLNGETVAVSVDIPLSFTLD